MQIITDLSQLPDNQKTILTIGMFDGVHRGHQQIIQFLNQLANNTSLQSCLLTFWPHPRMVLQQDSDLALLTTQEEKVQLLEQFGLNNLYIQNFDIEFSRLSSTAFVRDFLVKKLNLNTLVIGHDHHFGRNREGNFDALQELSDLYGFSVMQLEAIQENSLPISSTKIRNALHNGDLAYTNEALGYEYLITGKVEYGDGIGKTLGFPTINLNIEANKLLPKDGVYGVGIELNKVKHYGLLNIGYRPTFNGNSHRAEVYILDYNNDLYGQKVQLHLMVRIRDESSFDSRENLVQQINIDEQNFRNYLEK